MRLEGLKSVKLLCYREALLHFPGLLLYCFEEMPGNAIPTLGT